MSETTETSIFRARPGQVAYGYPIGILCAEWHIPFVPGDLNHAATFNYPVRYLSVDGVSGANVLRGEAANFTQKLVEGAKRLEAEGVRAITGNCGFMAVCQEEVAAAVKVPVFLSSLLQVPMLTRMIGGRKLGVLAANSAAMTAAVLGGAGISDTTNLVIKGLESFPHFNDVILQESGELDLTLMNSEVVQAARDLVAETPDLGAIFLECSDLPVYSHAISSAIGLPVFDWASYVDYVHRSVVPRTYTGIY